MKITNFISNLRLDGKAFLHAHGTDIGVAIGIAGFVASIVTASRATLKFEKALAEADISKKRMQEAYENEEVEYSKEDYEEDSKALKKRLIFTAAKDYASTVVIVGMSVTALILSHNSLKNQVAGLATALNTSMAAYNNLYSNVAEVYGKETAEKLNKKIVVKEEEVVDENGEKTTKKTVEVEDEGDSTNWTYLYDETTVESHMWYKDPVTRLLKLQALEKTLNYKLRAEKILTVNDILEALGMEQDKDFRGKNFCWYYTEEHESTIDLGLGELTASILDGRFEKECMEDPTGGWWLHFKPDAVITTAIFEQVKTARLARFARTRECFL